MSDNYEMMPALQEELENQLREAFATSKRILELTRGDEFSIDAFYDAEKIAMKINNAQCCVVNIPEKPDNQDWIAAKREEECK